MASDKGWQEAILINSKINIIYNQTYAISSKKVSIIPLFHQKPIFDEIIIKSLNTFDKNLLFTHWEFNVLIKL
ncbi:hypothetical protein CON68_28790 [Bacillus toyonensis]|nr:hypothetical protein A6J74_01070 [Bacillus sp. FDAARGOS_235]PDZ30792.1 hypothetical protein CON68_28790 [Bacillus toyonensis]PEC65055.1 hypothetical protein CON62_23280 [Bacillus toyonensis]PEI40272.1 hypothetical protein CN631_29980 [Bacillus toyonensis]PEI54567.1 hypothetical protein CN642_29335 [Bacillus toyonensis]